MGTEAQPLNEDPDPYPIPLPHSNAEEDAGGVNWDPRVPATHTQPSQESG